MNASHKAKRQGKKKKKKMKKKILNKKIESRGGKCFEITTTINDIDAAVKERSHRGEKGGWKIGLKLKKKKCLQIKKKKNVSKWCVRLTKTSFTSKKNKDFYFLTFSTSFSKKMDLTIIIAG